MADKMKKEYDVFAIGTPVVDYLAYCGSQFLEKHKLEKNASNYISRVGLDKMCLSPEIEITKILPGDNARNVCEGISYLGGKCAYAGLIGSDKEGEIFQESLAKNKITSCLEKKGKHTGKALTLIAPDAGRTFALNLGNTEEYEKIGKKEEKALAQSSFLFLTSITLLSSGKIGKTSADYIECARKYAVPVAFALESYPMIEKNRDELSGLFEAGVFDILFANEEEFTALGISSSRQLAQIAYKLSPTVVLKRGDRGATVFSSTSRTMEAHTTSIHIPPKRVLDVVDTTGAGDFFAAGFLRGWCKEKKLGECGKIGAKLAGKVIGKIGATLD